MRLGIYSTINGLAWGGSEALWHEAALIWQSQGHTIGVNYQWYPNLPKQLSALRAAGGALFLRNRPAPRPIKLPKVFVDKSLQFVGRYHDLWLRQFAPDFVLISVSYHTDDVSIANACLRYGIPFAILLHCASMSDWITIHHLQTYRNAYLQSEGSFFVSAENQAIMERLLAAKIPQACTIHNPIDTKALTALPWPSDASVWRLACVARLHFRSKGQDLILEVLRREQWRDRPIEVVFWGKDQGNQRQLEDLARLYGIQDKVRVGGFAPIEEIWASSHALLLPSRFEGMPMVTAEAMLCGRIAIVTTCGRNAEWVDDGETGFLAAAPTVDELDAAMEKAWQCRQDWQAMGTLAAERLQQRYSPSPVEDFVSKLEALQSTQP